MLENATYNGQTYWFSPNISYTGDVFQKTYLLPNYDEYGIAYRDRSAFFDADRASRLIFSHLIFINGRLVGTWKRTLKRTAVVIETNTFERLTKAEGRAVAAAARQYGEFLGLPVSMNADKNIGE